MAQNKKSVLFVYRGIEPKQRVHPNDDKKNNKKNIFSHFLLEEVFYLATQIVLAVQNFTNTKMWMYLHGGVYSTENWHLKTCQVSFLSVETEMSEIDVFKAVHIKPKLSSATWGDHRARALNLFVSLHGL